MIHNVLARQLPLSSAEVAAALAAAGIAPDRRPQTLSVGEWLALEVSGRSAPTSVARRRPTGDDATGPIRRGRPHRP